MAPSWTLHRAPITTGERIALTTQLYQTLDSAPMVTSPMMTAFSATKAVAWTLNGTIQAHSRPPAAAWARECRGAGPRRWPADSQHQHGAGRPCRDHRSARSAPACCLRVPSATITWPACRLYPMPTPPPWWKLTQVAPPTAFMSIQDRPIGHRVRPVAHGLCLAEGTGHAPTVQVVPANTMGAFSTPFATMSLISRPNRARSP